MDTLYCGKKLEILFDSRNPYSLNDVHPEWIKQFITTVNSGKVHEIVDDKLRRFGDISILYSKIKPDVSFYEERSGRSVFIISSVGEHSTTPWMILHNVGHTLISNNIRIKRDVLKLLGKHGKFSIDKDQSDLVCCASARDGRIPNINEVIYELYATWLWYGHTVSPDKRLAEYCDNEFSKLMKFYDGKVVWHRYRSPVEAHDSDLFSSLL